MHVNVYVSFVQKYLSFPLDLIFDGFRFDIISICSLGDSLYHFCIVYAIDSI